MSTQEYNLAQINIGHIRAPLDHPIMAGFVDQLDAVNALADQSPGFVWRLETEEGNATSIQAFSELLLLINLTVWETKAPAE